MGAPDSILSCPQCPRRAPLTSCAAGTARACRDLSPATGSTTVPTEGTSWVAPPRPRRRPAPPPPSSVATGAASRGSGAATAILTVATGTTRSPSCAGPPGPPAPVPPYSSPAGPASASTGGGAATGPPTVATAPTRRGVVRAMGGTGRDWDVRGGRCPADPLVSPQPPPRRVPPASSAVATGAASPWPAPVTELPTVATATTRRSVPTVREGAQGEG